MSSGFSSEPRVSDRSPLHPGRREAGSSAGRYRIPRCAIRVGIRYHLAGLSTREVDIFLEAVRVQRSHVAVHHWEHEAERQPDSAATVKQPAVDEKPNRLHGDEYRFSGPVDPETYQFFRVNLFPTTTRWTTRRFLAEFHRRYGLHDLTFLDDDVAYLGPVLAEDGSRNQVVSRRDRTAIERVFWQEERRTSSFAYSFSHVTLETTESWLEVFAVSHNSRQT